MRCPRPANNATSLRYYRALGIDRNDAPARSRATGRNFMFFDAAVGLIFTIDARLKKHSWLDCGMFIQNIMVAAKARGLGLFVGC
jgi:nitroreductase